jgi:hypothetical protein
MPAARCQKSGVFRRVSPPRGRCGLRSMPARIRPTWTARSWRRPSPPPARRSRDGTRTAPDARARRWLGPHANAHLEPVETRPTGPLHVVRVARPPKRKAAPPPAHRGGADLGLTCDRRLPHLRDHGRCRPPQTRSHRLGKFQHSCRRSRLGGTRRGTFLAARLLAPGTTQGPLRARNVARGPAVGAGHHRCGT